MIPKRKDSWMFHYPNVQLTYLFAKTVGIPLVKSSTSGIKEKELKDLKTVLSQLDVKGIVSGAISSSYQKKRIDKICQDLNLVSITPLWQENPLDLLKEILKLHFEVIIIGVYAFGFDKSWLGKNLDLQTINRLLELNKKFGISLVGEGGEYETQVLDAPYFKKRIKLLETEIFWEKESGFLRIKKAKLMNKT